MVEHEVDVDPFTGAARLHVPLRTSEGRDGFTPSLALIQSGAAAGGVFGTGWSLTGAPSVTRDTALRVPRYDDEDVFRYAGAELVRTNGRVDGDFDIAR